MKIEFNPGIYSINAYKNIQRNTIKRNIHINDRVEISEAALKMLSDKDELRSKKIANIKDKIDKGQYEVNAADIADRIIKNISLKYTSKKE